MSDKEVSAPTDKKPKASSSRLKGSVRQQMLINYVKDGTVPEGFYVITTKKGVIQFRRKKENNTEELIKKYEDKIKKLKETPSPSEESENKE